MAKKRTYKRPKVSGIYIITNTIDNKQYIGQSLDIFTRWASHYNASTKIWNQLHLYNAIRKYGIKNFKFEIMVLCDPKHLNSYEMEAIKQHQPEYNTLLKGDK